jgi:hypothetical protein
MLLIAVWISSGCVTPARTDDDAQRNAGEVKGFVDQMTGFETHLPGATAR